MQAFKITYANNDKDVEYVKRNRFRLFNNIIVAPSNIMDKITLDDKLYRQLIIQQNKFAINNYKEKQ
jgi:hypothetical protein